jgi:toprim domain protein
MAKIIIVEGKHDKNKLLEILDEQVDIICTYGTLGEEKIEEMILPYELEDVYVFVDADESGNKIRKRIKQSLPNARHLYTRRMYGQVSDTPVEYLVKVLTDAHFLVKPDEKPNGSV